MCPHRRAHWRNLTNMIKPVRPSAHPSPQPKWQIDRFSHFCTAHGRVSSGMSGHVLSLNNCPFAWGIWASCNTCFLGPTRVHNPNGTSIGSAVFAQFTSECRRTCRGMPLPLKIVPSHGDLYHGPPDSASQTTSRSAQPFLHSSRQNVPILFNGRPFPPKITHFNPDPI